MPFSAAARRLSLPCAVFLLAGCGAAERCVPGLSVECRCSSGATGAQVCQADGTFAACSCMAATADAGVPDAGSVDGGGADAGNVDAGPGDAGATDAGAIDAGPRVYVTLVPGASSNWSALSAAQGQVGLAAGRQACLALGGDHPCEYQEVLRAQARGELSPIAAGTTAWIHRTTTAMVGGVISAPGAGGRCLDWNYLSNHTADGEYVTFADGGVPTYHLDNDTVYDGDPGSGHTTSGDLECGGLSRAILCCAAP